MTGKVSYYDPVIRPIPPGMLENSALFFNKGIVSLLSAPLESSGTIYGILGFSSATGPMKIKDGNLEIIKMFANLIADKLKMARTEESIEHLAYYDQLTDLPNRMLFADRVKQAIYLAARQEKLLGIIYIDLNSFKSINDAFGHNIGDELIRKIAENLKQHLRKSDTVARFGSDEFIMLVNDIADYHAIPMIASNLMRLFKTPIRLEEQDFFLTASAGIAVYPVDGEDSETLIKNADLAMYKAKAAGSNHYVLCTDEMKDEVRQNMMLSNSLFRSLERGELSVHYQPLIRLDTETVIGVEALLRWNHSTLGMISPAVFIPIAEKNGLIGIIGEWVLRTACTQNKKWQDMGYPRCRISVNLSVVQLRNPRLAENIASILQETGLSPCDLELEITESAAMAESGTLQGVLNDLKKLGISISIDDFGTEYSSLNRLRELPIDRLKIDMQFIRALEHSSKDQAITMTIISLAKNLGLQVVAEGVETETQLEFLRSRNCDEVQGYYYFRPMPPEELERFIF
jgi:diguanylate cyclase (GGDEF)-like protein